MAVSISMGEERGTPRGTESVLSILCTTKRTDTPYSKGREEEKKSSRASTETDRVGSRWYGVSAREQEPTETESGTDT